MEKNKPSLISKVGCFQSIKLFNSSLKRRRKRATGCAKESQITASLHNTALLFFSWRPLYCLLSSQVYHMNFSQEGNQRISRTISLKCQTLVEKPWKTASDWRTCGIGVCLHKQDVFTQAPAKEEGADVMSCFLHGVQNVKRAKLEGEKGDI